MPINIAETSISAFVNNQVSILSREDQAYEVLLMNEAKGPRTSRELYKLVQHTYPGGTYRDNMCARLAGLRTRGRVINGPKRECEETGEIVLTWKAIPLDQQTPILEIGALEQQKLRVTKSYNKSIQKIDEQISALKNLSVA